VQLRNRSLYQVCAIVLLVWTVVDLTNVGLCALDNENPVGTPAATMTMRAVDDAGVPGSGEPAPHIDDCFCCSRCVEASQTVGWDGVDFVTRRVRVCPDRLPMPDHASVYHPPQFLN
jgi:hypothetical protein